LAFLQELNREDKEINTMFLSLIRMIQAFREYNRNLDELSRLSDRELADIGLGSVRGRGGLSHRAGGATGVAIEDVGYGGVCKLQPRTDGDPDDRDQHAADRAAAKAR